MSLATHRPRIMRSPRLQIGKPPEADTTSLLVDQLAKQAEETQSPEIKRWLLTAACELLDKALTPVNTSVH